MRFFNLIVEYPKVTRIPVRQLGLAKVVVVRTTKNGGVNSKRIPIETGCEWGGCDKAAKITTSTETTTSGVIKLCNYHFVKLPI